MDFLFVQLKPLTTKDTKVHEENTDNETFV